MYQRICYDVSEHIALISLDRAEKLNAYTPEMGEEIVAAFEQAREDPEVRVVIITGRGRAFCAGVDMDYFKAHMAGENISTGPKLGEEHFVRGWPLELAAYPKPVIAAINGPAYGVGVTMTLACDVRLAADTAKLGLNFTSLGVLPGLGSTHLLPQLVGVAKSLELVLSAAVITAQEAESIGLVQQVVPAEELLPQALLLAEKMARIEPQVLAAAKQALRHGAMTNLEASIAMEQTLSAQLAASN